MAPIQTSKTPAYMGKDRAQVDATDSVQETPLPYAVSQGAIKQAQALLENGSSIMARDAEGRAVLYLATWPYIGSPDMINWLVKSGADVN
ncbi:hypothetical protein EYZ11_008702 [Aspergillus tanneri]|uniref:Uncharacterized protein n=1 Tax=Aspergillus tanneri TaxID=1220188 RepID=A0A4S3JA47_9EURO|nr:hypothetical protein EYZ11_008702 [Aspergillus tanneri]